MRSCAAPAEMRAALHGERALSAPRGWPSSTPDRQPAGARRRWRPRPTTSSCSTRPRHLAAPVRACARRLARPRPGDDRPGADLREGRPVPRPGELPDYLPVVLEFASTQPPPRRAPSWARWRTSSTPSSTRCKSAERLCQRAGRAARAGRRKGAAPSPPARRAARRSWAEPLAFDGCSTKGQAGPASRSPSTSSARSPPHKERRMMSVRCMVFCSRSTPTSASRCS
jgi:hypothetical protein